MLIDRLEGTPGGTSVMTAAGVGACHRKSDHEPGRLFSVQLRRKLSCAATVLERICTDPSGDYHVVASQTVCGG